MLNMVRMTNYGRGGSGDWGKKRNSKLIVLSAKKVYNVHAKENTIFLEVNNMDSFV